MGSVTDFDFFDLDGTGGGRLDPTHLAATLVALTDGQLADLTLAVQAEHQRRAIDGGDLDAIAAQALEDGFDPTGLAMHPYVHEHLIVCPGSKLALTKSSHRCRFVAVGDDWAWDSPQALLDRVIPSGKPGSTRSVTLLPLVEGLELDVVTSKARQNVHERQESHTYKVRDGELTLTGTRGRARRIKDR